MQGMKEVASAFEAEAGCHFGETTSDGLIGLRFTSCIGLSDQAPAALINSIPITNLTPAKAKQIIRDIRSNKKLVNNVQNNIVRSGEVFFTPYIPGEAILKALTLTPLQVRNEIIESRLTGRGGAGFPTGMKWKMASEAVGDQKYVICNADEGEPGTFKDRALLTNRPGLLIEGMAVAAHAIGATQGIIYLRMEYTYLYEHLLAHITDFKQKKLLGNFEIDVRLGAGAYVCGEETALLESLEGKRGEPRNRPPFPIQSGYLGMPTLVNNVETLCAAAQIIKLGSLFYKNLGTEKSTGTKLLSVSGDVTLPGVYEIQWGMTICQFLEMVGAVDPYAIVVGGPSGRIIAASEITRKLCAEDLPTAGAMVVINSTRDLLGIVNNYMHFFTDESCGACLPCRGGNVLLTQLIEKIRSGLGDKLDLEKLQTWSHIIKSTSRCGLGQTSSQPILSTLTSFRKEYEKLLTLNGDGAILPFNLALAEEHYNNIFKAKD
jgi:[NiFe] hydrogenase diaphorase moiety large subunit